MSKFEPDELKAEEYDEYFDERDDDDDASEGDIFTPFRIKPKVNTFEEGDYENEKAESKTEEEENDDVEVFKSGKRRRVSHVVPTKCVVCKKTYCSKSAVNEHMQVGKNQNQNQGFCFVQLIHRPRRTKNQLYKNPNIS